MKIFFKCTFVISSLSALFLLLSTACLAAGSVDQSGGAAAWGTSKKIVTLPVTGDASDGSLAAIELSDEIMNDLTEFLLTSVCSYPTPDGTAPSATTSAVTNSQGRDVLGGKGVSTALVPTSSEQCTRPYNTFTGLYEYYEVDGPLSITGGTGNAGQEYTVKLIFLKAN
jgi:hypothetical protein